MSNEQPAAGNEERGSEERPQPNGPSNTGEAAEIVRLRDALAKAEQDRDACREALRVAQAERDEFRRGLYDLFARQGPQFSEEELIRLMREEAGLELEEFIGELEQAAGGG